MNEENDNYLPLPVWEDGISFKKPDTPDIPDFLKDDDWFSTDITADFLDFTEPYRPPRWTMKRGNIQFANVGELHLISGKAGHGKTNLMSQFIAAILAGKAGGTEYTKPETVVSPVVLYIDTEQGKDDTIALKNRICTMANMDYSKKYDSFHILRLRDTEKASDRWKKILKAIWMIRPTDIFLDGMLDIVMDYNDQKECQPVIYKCMKVSTYYDASLWMVLHENPMVDKLVGTLGSITQRKVSEIFSVKKHKQSEENKNVPGFPEIYFEVKQLKARGIDMPTWYFEVVSNVKGWGMPVEIDEKGIVSKPEDIKLQQEKTYTDDYLKLVKWTTNGVTYTDIEKFLRSKGITSHRKLQSIFNIGLEQGIIYKNNKGKYFYSGLDKSIPNDTPNDIPFEQQDENEEPPY